MLETELEGASTRRVLRQAGEVLNRELDVLYADKRDNQQTIAGLQTRVNLFDSEKATWDSERRDLEGKITRDRARMKQDGKVLYFTIKFAIAGWIVALVAIGYGVWVG